MTNGDSKGVSPLRQESKAGTKGVSPVEYFSGEPYGPLNLNIGPIRVPLSCMCTAAEEHVKQAKVEDAQEELDQENLVTISIVCRNAIRRRLSIGSYRNCMIALYQP